MCTIDYKHAAQQVLACIGGKDNILSAAHSATRMRLVRPKLANYEGLCEGSRLADGRRTWLLVSDSQGGYGNRLCHLRDWIRVCVSPKIK